MYANHITTNVVTKVLKCLTGINKKIYEISKQSITHAAYRIIFIFGAEHNGQSFSLVGEDKANALNECFSSMPYLNDSNQSLF